MDDHEDLCELIEVFLQQAGFNVATTRSTTQAWRLLMAPALPVDLMIADATLRERDDGLRLVEKARMRFPRMRTIVLSGDANVKGKAYLAGASSVLIKPVQPGALIAEVQRLTAPAASRSV